jgi:hypothetical protein
MLNLERAHDQLRHACRLLENGAQPVIDLRPAARAIERAFKALYDAYDERTDRFEAARAALGEVDAAERELATAAQADAAIGFALEYLREAHKEIAQAEDRLAPLVPRPREPAPDLRASKDTLMLHSVDGSSLVPTVRVPPPAPPEVDESPPETNPTPATFEDLDAAVAKLRERVEARRKAREEKREAERARLAEERAQAGHDEPPPGFVRDVPRVQDEPTFLRGKLRECFEEVAMLGLQRAPLLGDPWRSALFLEQRMLASLDAIVALGPGVYRELEAIVLDSPVKDPSRVFGVAMVFGCLAGRDALAVSERIFLAFEQSDPEHAVRFAEGLKLVPHPLLSVTLRTFLGDSDPAHRALAIDVLAFRRMATLEELAHAAVDAPEVAAAALPYYALTKHPGVPGAIAAALAQEGATPALREAAWLAMLYAGDHRATSTLVRELGGELGDRAGALLGIAGERRDATKLLDFLRQEPTRPRVTAVGWAGSTEAIPALLNLLDHEDDAMRLTAAYALDRITGAGLYERAEVAPEEIIVPDPPEPDVGEPKPQPLAIAVSDPRDLPAMGAADVVERPTVRRDRWEAYWKEHADKFDANARYRRGHAYTPLVSLHELDSVPCTPGERRLLQRELVVRTGGFVPLDPIDFVVVQEEALKEWEPFATRSSGSPGSWALPMRK